MKSFSYDAPPARIVFGQGMIDTIAEEVRRLGRSRVMVLASRRLDAVAAAVTESLGDMAVARFDGAVMHTPIEVTTAALRLAENHHVDTVVAIGGGSATGLSKALALRAGFDQIVVPTTYAGSEVTPVLGETENGRKTTRSSPHIRPETVIYDVDLTLDLPLDTTVTSAVNAMAHAVEALYSTESNPITDLMAIEAISGIARALPSIVDDPKNLEGRAELLQAAWLGTVGMGLHHKLCHTLGGSFGLPHAPTHAVVLPQAMAFNAPGVPEVMSRIATALGVSDAATGVFDLVTSCGGPTSLREVGMSHDQISRAVELATSAAYPNPREITAPGLSELLENAWSGRRPAIL
ncbi:maleylacetate reductase [Rhodococcus qingshengii]|uniref:maleylacetate reductase n=1 Tax=Rhodococcus qingshengii TaxID=334542 RepID=UPI0018788F23|nr:maleylacetate reductase [Rhodococcus qingshengii]QOS65126.1 maleylacetate reductase [Rhodococcus qingshengii]